MLIEEPELIILLLFAKRFAHASTSLKCFILGTKQQNIESQRLNMLKLYDCVIRGWNFFFVCAKMIISMVRLAI